LHFIISVPHNNVSIRKTIVSEDILSKDFVCNLTACKGACCVNGDAGAPLSLEETTILEGIYPKVKPFLRKQELLLLRHKVLR
jgi:hypothetical protein